MTRVRGFQDWRPRKATQDRIDQITELVERYRDEGLLPITIRQLFYRLIAEYLLPKTEQSYQQLCEIVNRARRARVISMSAIRDDGFRMDRGSHYEGQSDFFDAVSRSAESYRIDRQDGQPNRLMLWCEAGGMVPQLRKICDPYSIPVASSGGFDSTTAKHDIAQQLSTAISTTVLHIGDHDPSGVHIFNSLREDITAFANYYDGDIQFTRLAVLPEHIAKYDLPTAPPKKSDRRSFEGDKTVQAEALDPAVMSQLVRESIESRLDIDAYHLALGQEEIERKEIVERVRQSGLN